VKFRIIKFFKKAFRFTYKIIEKYFKDDLTVKAAGLAFYQLLTLIPILMVLFYILGKILNHEAVFIRVLRSLTIFKPDIQKIVIKNVSKIMETGIITAVTGFFIFLFLIRKYLRELFFAVRKIIGEDEKRPKTIKGNIKRYIKTFLLQLFYVIFFILTIGISGLLSHLAFNTFGVLEEAFGIIPTSFLKLFLSFVLIIIPVIANAFFYYFIFWHTPDMRPKKKYALYGGLFVSITNFGLRFLYKLYLESVLYKSNIYGALSTVAALVLWYYFTSIVVMFGALVVHRLQEDYS
jgi:membrane protein